jgi:hypothetical protein
MKTESPETADTPKTPKKPYQSPQLYEYGSIRKLTLTSNTSGKVFDAPKFSNRTQ